MPACKEIIHYCGVHAVYCVAEADASGFCPVHRLNHRDAVDPPPRPKRVLDADVLPWSSRDERAFDQLRPGGLK
jgi:hypothetical protein